MSQYFFEDNSDTSSNYTDSTTQEWNNLLNSLNVENKLLEHELNYELLKYIKEEELPEIENLNINSNTELKSEIESGVELKVGMKRNILNINNINEIGNEPPPLKRQKRFRELTGVEIEKNLVYNFENPKPFEFLWNKCCKKINTTVKFKKDYFKPNYNNYPDPNLNSNKQLFCNQCNDPIPNNSKKNLCNYCFSYHYWQKNYNVKLNNKYNAVLNNNLNYINRNKVTWQRYKECRKTLYCFECNRYMEKGCLVGRISLDFNFDNDNAAPSCGSCIKKYLKTL